MTMKLTSFEVKIKNKRSIMLLLLFLISTAFASDPTYTKDIKPIFKNRCSKCHDYMQDKNWQVYENAFKYKEVIKAKMISKEMPMGEDMPQEERNLIIKWVDTGAKE